MHRQKRTVPTLKLLSKELYGKVASKWEDIGIQLDIDDGLLSEVKANYHGDSASSLREMLRIWLKKSNPEPSWNDIVEALECLREEKLSQELNEKYCV